LLHVYVVGIPPTTLETPRLKAATFILMAANSAASNAKYFPVGTAFCIGPKFAVTAYHNLPTGSGSKKNCPRLGLCKSIYSNTISNGLLVTLTTYYSEADDWAILSPEDDAVNFQSFLELCNIDQLPGSDEPINKMIRTIHAPCGLYYDETGSTLLELHVEKFCNITGYHPEAPPSSSNKRKALGVTSTSMKSSVSVAKSTKDDPDYRWISVWDGLHSGSCGCPYLDTNHRVVAIHIYSTNEAAPVAEAVSNAVARLNSKKRKTFDTSSTEAHCNGKEGLVLCKIRGFVEAVRLLLNVDINHNFV
jgi:hypothetical protein